MFLTGALNNINWSCTDEMLLHHCVLCKFIVLFSDCEMLPHDCAVRVYHTVQWL